MGVIKLLQKDIYLNKENRCRASASAKNERNRDMDKESFFSPTKCVFIKDGEYPCCLKHMSRRGMVEHSHAFICFSFIWGQSRRGKGVLGSYISWRFLPETCCYIYAFENSKTLSLLSALESLSFVDN